MRRLLFVLASATALPMLLTMAPAQSSVTAVASTPLNVVRCSGTRQPPSAFIPATDQLSGPGGSCGRDFQYVVTPTHGATATYNFNQRFSNQAPVFLSAYVPRGHATARVDYKIYDCSPNPVLISRSATFDQSTKEGWQSVTLNTAINGPVCISKVVLESGMVSSNFDMAMSAVSLHN